MSERLSENSFRKGLEAVGKRDFLEALAYFEASMQLVRREGGAPPPMKYLSYYGLCLAMSGNRLRQALELCEGAVEAEFYNPDLYLNLGRVYLRTGDRGRAFEALVRGLQLNPRHTGLIRQIRRLGVRRAPILRFLSRSHPVNRILGRLWPRVGSNGFPKELRAE
jgi:tetratricopeptide (TPR) repeat protein